MEPKRLISKQTRDNWIIASGLFIAGITAALTGIYFLFAPAGGYQGGRNPFYGTTFLFSHETWSDIHTWSSILLVAIAIIHIPLHWQWIVGMSKKVINRISGRNMRMSNRSKFNLLINTILGISFLITTVSGMYFFLNPGSLHASSGWLGLSRTTLKDIHTWSGVIIMIMAGIHFWIHWKWIIKVTKRIFDDRQSQLNRTNKALESPPGERTPEAIHHPSQ